MIQAPSSRLHVNPQFLAVLLAAIVAAGCGTPTPDQPPRPQRPLAEIAAERPVVMRGDGSFFDGQVTAQLTVSRGLRSGERFREDYQQRNPDVYVINESEFEEEEREKRIAVAEGRRRLGSTAPAVALRLILTNTTQQPVDVEILEVNSSLGNFAVRPERLTVPAQESAQPEPMNSRLGVTADEIPVKVSLRIGDRTETHTISVKNLLTRAPQE